MKIELSGKRLFEESGLFSWNINIILLFNEKFLGRYNDMLLVKVSFY